MGRADFINVINGICSRRNWQLTTLSHDWILKLHDPARNASTCVFGYVFDVNPSGATEICKEKAATSQLLSSYGIPCLEHEVFLSSSMVMSNLYVPITGTWPRLTSFAEKHNWDIVLKPLKGTAGNGIFRVNNQRELEQAAQSIFDKEYGLAACPYKKIVDEYRVIWMDHARLVYRKIRQTVTGDGKSTVQELIANALLSCKADQVSAMIAALSSTSEGAKGLLANAANASRVPPAGEVVPIQWKHNLGHGGVAERVSSDSPLYGQILDVAEKTVKALGMRFCSVDIIDVENTSELAVMEVNCGVMMDNAITQLCGGSETAAGIYEAAIEAGFDRNCLPPRGDSQASEDHAQKISQQAAG